MRFMQDLYMDDSVTGAQNIDEAFDYYMFMKTLLIEGGVELRKWRSNSGKLLEAMHEYENLYYGNASEEESDNNKILGIAGNSEM